MRAVYHIVEHGQIRLSTLLLLILLILGVVSVNGAPNLNPDNIFRNIKGTLPGGDPLKLRYQLVSQCSDQLVQISRPSKHVKASWKMKRKGRHMPPVHARGLPANNFTFLTFVSNSNGNISIRGGKSNKFLCFNRKGKLVLRWSGHNQKRCQFKESTTDGYYTYESAVNADWYLGFRKNGKPLKGFRYKSTKLKPCFTFLKIQLRPRQTQSPFNFDEGKLLEQLQKFKDGR